MEATNPTRGTCWFVGAMYHDNKRTMDQSARFIKEGIWENGYHDKYLEEVKDIQIGARIAIKAVYTKKHNLPFDNRGHVVSVMAIKAIGTVTENPGDGRHLKISWKPLPEPREWYFYTYQRTVWRVIPDSWYAQNLIAFAFEGKEQDLARFRNDPYWRGRFGDKRDKLPDYTVENIMQEGCFLDKSRLYDMLKRLHDKKISFFKDRRARARLGWLNGWPTL